LAQRINIVHGKIITRHKQVVYYKEQNGQSLLWSGCTTEFISNVKCPNSLVRNSSGQVNDTADDIVPFSVVNREQKSITNKEKTKTQELRHARKESIPIVESFALLLFEGAPIRHRILRLEAR
jgi:hypothetical protein